jgi:hypothetical protein
MTINQINERLQELDELCEFTDAQQIEYDNLEEELFYQQANNNEKE